MSGRVPAVIVPGEEELGPQRWCGHCEEFHPLDREFWQTTRMGRGLVCRAAAADANRRALERTVRALGITASSGGGSARRQCADCPVTIPATRTRCYFCTRTVALRKAASAA